MPIYEYACKSCNTKFDQLAKSMSNETAIPCPKCGSRQTSRALSLFAVGAEGASKSEASSEMPMCGRCGGPGPCGMN